MEGTDRMEENKKPTFEVFKKELIEAERFGNIAVRTTVENALSIWRMDYENLARMSDFMICQAHVADVHQGKELTGTYAILIHLVWDCAKECLSPDDYHRFRLFSQTSKDYDYVADLLIEELHLK